MKKYIKILRKCPLFKNIADEDLLRMLVCLGARVVQFDKKFTIMAEGGSARYIGIVLSGSVQIARTDYWGNRSIIAHAEVGEVFGEAFACSSTAAIPVDITAVDECEIMLVECSHILHTCSNSCGFHQQLIFNLMKDLAEKALMFHQKIEIISQRTTREKVMTYLNFQAKKAGESEFEIPFDRQELADYLGVERSGLSAELGKLVREGVLETSKNKFRLL